MFFHLTWLRHGNEWSPTCLYTQKSVEVAILAGLGGLLVAIYLLLPESLRTELVFTYGEPSLVSAWTAERSTTVGRISCRTLCGTRS